MSAELDLCAQSNQAIDWNTLYADQLPRVYNYFRYRLGDGLDAQDLTATTFEKAWRGRNRYQQNRGAFSTWLFTIARNVAIDHYRRQHPALSLEIVEPPSDVPGPDERMQCDEEMARLGALLAQLPGRERELVALKYGAGLTNRSIAGLTGLSESNVGTILHRVVCHLRDKWEPKQ